MAKRRNKKRRAVGGMLLGVKTELKSEKRIRVRSN